MGGKEKKKGPGRAYEKKPGDARRKKRQQQQRKGERRGGFREEGVLRREQRDSRSHLLG